MSGGNGRTAHEGYYDIRRGAAGYAPTIGAFGALSVPAVVVLFTTRPAGSDETLVALAAGLLVVSMIGSLIAAIGMAAIGSETEHAANLPPAIMFVAGTVVTSLVDILAAFEVLAAIYLREARFILTVITAFAGILGVFFTTLALADSWFTGPSDGKRRRKWLKKQWLRSQKQAQKATRDVTLVALAPVVAGLALRLSRVAVPPTMVSVDVVIGAGLLLCVAGVVAGSLRTMHPRKAYSPAVRRGEAYGITLTVSCYTLLVLLFLP
jgi:hypothetical protein